jgi:hypothetical protein
MPAGVETAPSPFSRTLQRLVSSLVRNRGFDRDRWDILDGSCGQNAW